MNQPVGALQPEITRRKKTGSKYLIPKQDDELPEEASLLDVLMKYGQIADEAARDRGIPFPALTPDVMTLAGADWHLFPDMVFLPAPDAMLACRARTDRNDPERCMFEVYSLVSYPDGEGPPLERHMFADRRDHDGCGPILEQDFENMTEVQRGMRSMRFGGSRANPVQERSVSHFHRALREFVGA